MIAMYVLDIVYSIQSHKYNSCEYSYIDIKHIVCVCVAMCVYV